MKLLKKLLFSKQDKKQLVLAVIGAFLGIIFLLLSIHYLIRINEYGEDNDVLGPNVILVSKKISNSNTLQLASNLFSNEEIDKLKNEPFIENAKPVVSNNFSVELETSDSLVPYFRSDVFIQTVDTSFLDVKSSDWSWDLKKKYVPIILPREFVVMLNTFMISSGIPQISDDLIKQVKFRVKLSNGTKDTLFFATIVGFTNEVSSILVPSSFMEYGKTNFSNTKDDKITQVMLLGKEKQFGLLEEFLKEKHYESKKAQLLSSRLKSVISTLLVLVLIVSLVSVFVSMLVIIQYIQLLISRNVYEIRTLLRIGYSSNQLLLTFMRYFIVLFMLICIGGFTLYYVLIFKVDELLKVGGLILNAEVVDLNYLSISVLFCFFIVFSLFSAIRAIDREFSNI
jgi:hypothetical protein